MARAKNVRVFFYEVKLLDSGGRPFNELLRDVAATDCSPCRATLLTGLYSQQTCIFVTQDAASNPELPFPPSLQPWKQLVGDVLTPGQGFPTIGDVLSQSSPALNYNCVWIGKWHLSDNPLESESQYSCNPGGNGPSDYGFTDPVDAPLNYSIPTPPGQPPGIPLRRLLLGWRSGWRRLWR
jgi:arylsulfatase A-like enzyme